MQYNLLPTFLAEADDLLTQIEDLALSLCTSEQTDETIHGLFRALHTLKGSGQMCGLTRLSGFAHHLETLLDRVRGGGLAVSPKLKEVVLASRDHLLQLLAIERGGEAVPSGLTEELVARIEQFGAAANPPQAVREAEAAPAATPAQAELKSWNIRFRPDPAIFMSGANPILLFRELRELGCCEIRANTGNIPELETMQPAQCYLSWDIVLQTAASENAIRDVFIFVEYGSDLQIEQVEAPLQAASSPAPAAAERPAAAEPVRAEASVRTVTPKAAAESTVRVPAGRLDRLVNLVGELVMNQSRLTQAAAQHGSADLANPVQELERLVAELRDNVLGIRMLPIGTLFGRFRRLVHDLSAELGKEIDLITEGAETELDKSILDQLGEPMVHLLRNAIDHGIERAETRTGKGKPARGTIRLAAAHTGSAVVISIEDDGRGIDRAAVRAKAIEKQLIAPGANLSEKEILNLILLPGFSTAQQLTSVSGRGVGMDVVKKQIDALRGSLSFFTQEGQCTRVTITLPLTLAIIEGLLVEVGCDQFIVPMAAVTENVELTSAQRRRNNSRNVIAVRGDLVPYIDLRKTFRIAGSAPEIEKVVIVKHEDQRVGFVVDRVLGTHQTVIQSLGRFFRNIEVVSGATIMGDGRVALIVDGAAIVRLADQAA